MTARPTKLDSEGRRTGVATTNDGKQVHFVIFDEIELYEGDRKRIVFQKLRFKDGHEQYRFGYYVLGTAGDRKDRWVWARSAPMIFQDHLKELLSQAHSKGWI